MKTIKEKIEIMQAYEMGKKIQISNRYIDLWKDIDCPLFDWVNCDYRIKTKFNIGDVVQYKDSYKVKIIEVNTDDNLYGYESLFAKGIGCIPFDEENDWKLVQNKFDITTLKPFDKVLMRSSNAREWDATLFSHYSNNKFYGCGMCCDQCIPYEGNEHLLGTTNECDDFYKNWE